MPGRTWLSPRVLGSLRDRAIPPRRSDPGGTLSVVTRSGAPALASGRREVAGPEDPHDLGLAVPDDVAEPLGPFDDFVQRLDLHDRPAAHQLLQLDGRTVGDGELAALAPESLACGFQCPRRHQDAGLDGLLNELAHLLHELWGRGRTRVLRVEVGVVRQELHDRASFGWELWRRSPGSSR